MNLRYRVELSQSEHAELMQLLSGGTYAVRKLKRAQVLLAADSGASDEEIARSIGVGKSTIYRTKRRFVLGNLKAALSEDPRRGAERKFSGKEEALLVATACSSPPAGRARWTLELLAGEMVKLTTHESVSRETVRRRLAENDLKPWRTDRFARRLRCQLAGLPLGLSRYLTFLPHGATVAGHSKLAVDDLSVPEVERRVPIARSRSISLQRKVLRLPA